MTIESVQHIKDGHFAVGKDVDNTKSIFDANMKIQDVVKRP